MIKLHIDERCEYRLRRNLPWIFDKYAKDIKGNPKNGDLVAIYNRKNQCIKIGLYDAYSPISVRILGDPCEFSDSYIESRIESALTYRAGLNIFDSHTNGLRLLNGESEGLPGIVIDAFADTWVMKIYSSCWIPYMDNLISILSRYHGNVQATEGIHACQVPCRLILRLGRECMVQFGKAGYREGTLLFGSDMTPHADFLEHDAHFRAQVFKGQKTGFFLDQRDNRQLIRSLSKDKKVLDICCYSGGFSINAAIGHASSVWSLDGDRHALELVQKHYDLNQEHSGVVESEHVMQKCDMFEWLAKAKAKRMTYDLIIADPPSFASSQAQIPTAQKAYVRLFSEAATLLRPKGQILCCSCSSHIGGEKFEQIVKKALLHRTLEAVDYTGLPPDHVARFAEGKYLKAWLITVK